MATTFAGNFTLLGSVANLIVVKLQNIMVFIYLSKNI
jgi:Na+/H+ antiporter NhaD/arsenite permease-like protein